MAPPNIKTKIVDNKINRKQPHQGIPAEQATWRQGEVAARICRAQKHQSKANCQPPPTAGPKKRHPGRPPPLVPDINRLTNLIKLNYSKITYLFNQINYSAPWRTVRFGMRCVPYFHCSCEL